VPILPRVLAPNAIAGATERGALVGAGSGDNAASALGLGAGHGDVIISIGTSGVVCAVTPRPTADASGLVAGFADATGAFLPLTATLNGARVLDYMARMLGVGYEELSELALQAPPGCGGLVLVPYFEGERTPNRPEATAALHGLTAATSQRAHLARAAIEGLLCGLADGLAAIEAVGVSPRRALLIGGGAKSSALRRIAPSVFGMPVTIPPAGEYVADGAARQAAWALQDSAAPPLWPALGTLVEDAPAIPAIRERYAEVQDMTAHHPKTPH
jgi:xylulokinase